MRSQNWQKQFFDTLAAARDKPFQWGTHDCVMAATACIDAVMGTTYYAQAQERYPYSSEDEARAWIEQVGGITGLVASFLGDPVNWGQLTCGDVVLVGSLPMASADMEMLCVHDGVNLLGPSLGGGFMRVPFSYAIHGWALR